MAAFQAEAAALGRALAGYLEYLEALGSPGLPVAPPQAAPEKRARPPAVAGPPAALGSPADWAPRAASLAELAELTGRCRACPRGRGAAPPAFGRGGETPLLVLAGEDPGLYEGAAADLLAGLTARGLQLTPDAFYVSTALKCPPAPRERPGDPSAALAVCLPTLRRELALLRPKIVLALGEAPGGALAGQPDSPLGLLRTRSFTLDGSSLDGSSLGGSSGIWLRVTYSLEQMLEEPAIKAEAWRSDLLKIKNFLDKFKAGPA